jgi:hypothetical protein
MCSDMKKAFIILFSFTSLLMQAQDSSVIKTNKFLNDLKTNFSSPWSYKVIDPSAMLSTDSFNSPFLIRAYVFLPQMGDTALVYVSDIKNRDSIFTSTFKYILVKAIKDSTSIESMLIPIINCNKELVVVSYVNVQMDTKAFMAKWVKDFHMSSVTISDVTLEEEKEEPPPPPPPPPRPKRNQ